MNTAEINSIKKFVENSLDEKSLGLLTDRLAAGDDYTIFLSKLFEILIGKEKSVTLPDFLNLYNLSDKAADIQNKSKDLIEELADLAFDGYSSGNTEFLNISKNEIYLEHLEFLSLTRASVTKMGRETLKKKLGQLDELAEFELTDEEISKAVHASERDVLRNMLRDLDKKTERKTIFASITPSNFNQVLRYAAVILIVAGAGYFLYNLYEKPEQQFADKNPKVKTDSTLNQAPDTFKLPDAQQYTIERKILEAPSYGYAQRDEEKVKITLIDLSKQIAYLKMKCDAPTIAHSGAEPSAKRSCDKLDSLVNRNGSYIYNMNTAELIIYSDSVDTGDLHATHLRVLAIMRDKNKAHYLGIKRKYFMLAEDAQEHKLAEEKDREFKRRLMAIDVENKK